MFGWKLESAAGFYFLCIVLAIVSTLLVLNLTARLPGAFVAIRDSEISAQSMGINLAAYKTLSFAISAALTGWPAPSMHTICASCRRSSSPCCNRSSC